MASLKQRLENLEKCSGEDEMSHDDWVLNWMDKPSRSGADSPEITDEQIEEFLRPTKPGNSHADL
jgi:hypothetical protein